ncbi:MAG: DUF4890 domain-containing protein [Bacteroidales bacterium]|nr:DUF4890 domain-containing protein [Bacteroidales bacterium]
MKKTVCIAIVASFLSISAFAQAPAGDFPPMKEMPSVEEIVSNRTQEMVEMFGLDENQATLLAGLNNRYAGKIASLGAGAAFGEMPNFAEMSAEDRQNMFAHMDEMQQNQEEMQRNEDSYDEALKAILDKKQLKSYNKEKRREQMRQQQEMQAMFSRSFDGGGFGGDFGGGFGGGFAMAF